MRPLWGPVAENPLDGSANALAKVMRQRRIDRGALTLASAEVKFQIDTETHDPLDIANQMVEEFILAANISVAAKILEHFPPFSLLRYMSFFMAPSSCLLEYYICILCFCFPLLIFWLMGIILLSSSIGINPSCS
ncbi:unnamed protein product [Camellia sinensis]